MKIGLYFGSFNPIHVGHLIIAQHLAQHTDLEQVWLVVSPQNPFKPKATLANDYERLALARAAVADNDLLRVSDIEFGLEKPSYTVDTLAHLKEKFPQHQFSLIMGGDNLASFDKWKSYQAILVEHHIFVYARPGYDLGPLATHPSITILTDVPQMEISATHIRSLLKAGKSAKYLVPEAALLEIEKSGLYRNM